MLVATIVAYNFWEHQGAPLG